jgi:hypothetical protein
MAPDVAATAMVITAAARMAPPSPDFKIPFALPIVTADTGTPS